MSAVLIAAGTLGLLFIMGHLVWQAWAWWKLDETARAEQRQIKVADKALHAASRGRKKRLKAAESAITRANTTPVRARYGGLVLHDDHVLSGGREYPLTAKTKAKVVGHGRGDQRKVMVLLEDTTWSSSLSATKTGKPNELDAQQFAAETRVRAAHAVEARAARAQAVEQAQAGLRREQADTADVAAAEAARAALGERHRGAGPSPQQRWRRGTAIAALLALVVGGAIAPPSDSGSDSTAQAASAPTAASSGDTPAPAGATPAPTPDVAGLRARARQRVAGGDYAGALRAVQPLKSTDRAYVARLIGSRAARLARAALARGNRSAASHAIRAANVITPTKALRAAKADYDTAVAQASAARKARKAAAARRAAERRAAEREAAAAAESAANAAVTDPDSGDGGQYAGQNCTEIGHSFTVTPGSDPEHDRDNDGVACEDFQ